MTMHSWVFRNRARLRWIYGVSTTMPVVSTPEPVGAATEAREPVTLPPKAGRVVRESERVVLHPMPRRAS